MKLVFLQVPTFSGGKATPEEVEHIKGSTECYM
jgi:hypothetical protein